MKVLLAAQPLLDFFRFAIFIVGLSLIVSFAHAQTQSSGEVLDTKVQTPPETATAPPKPRKKEIKILNLELGVGYPGNSLEAPSKHFEVGLELFTMGKMRWGPYFGILMADSKETVNFPSTGYSEVRHSKITSYAGGLQGRWKLRPRFDVKAAFGLSYTQQEITSVDTTAPVPSTAVGYKKDYPVGLDGKAGLQYSIAKKNWAYGAELGFEVTSLTNSNQSFSAAYLNALLRYGF